MPNWCYSNITISGTKQSIDAIAAINLDFEKILPTPSELLKYSRHTIDAETRQHNIAKYGFVDWYEWRLHHWGTKWSADVQGVSREGDKILHINIVTPWGLPYAMFKKITKNYADVTLEVTDCEEESGAFVGNCTFKRGRCTINNIHEPTKEELRERGMLDEE